MWPMCGFGQYCFVESEAREALAHFKISEPKGNFELFRGETAVIGGVFGIKSETVVKIS